jgi:hypothetical protein
VIPHDPPVVFEPVVDFDAGGSQYLKGLRYTVRQGNHALADTVTQWIREGKVIVVQKQSGNQPATLGGIGKVG